MTDLPERPEKYRELLEREDWDTFGALFERQHPHAIAESLAPLDDETLWAVVRRLPSPLDGEVFSHLDIERQARLISESNLRESAEFIQHIAADDRVNLIRHLDHDVRRRLLAELDPEVRQDVERLAIYNEGTAGAVMNTDVTTLRAEQTVEEALRHLRSLGDRQETIYYNYVVDEHGRLLGIVSLRGLILADPATKLADLMSTHVIAAWVDDRQEDVARLIREYDLLALPILHGDHRLAGVVTVDDALDVTDEEATEDFHRMASVGHLTTGLREAGIGLLYRKRVPWLLALVFFNIFSGAGIAYYESTILAYASLVFFLPLLIDSGGNAGAQSATLMIRALALGDVTLKDWSSLLLKEMAVALAMGATMAAGVALIGIVRAPEVMVVVSLTMVCTVFVGSLIGMLFPFVLTRLRLDPATASAPLITSVADIAGVLIYFAIATWYLGIG
jgi:magnesium transporter